MPIFEWPAQLGRDYEFRVEPFAGALFPVCPSKHVASNFVILHNRWASSSPELR